MFRQTCRALGFALSSLVAISLAHAADDSFYRVDTGKNELKIMSYNVENLFDATHDDGKTDYEFLPMSSPLKKKCGKGGGYEKSCRETDWTAPKVTMKLKQIQKVVEAQGDLPDVLVVVEVENPNVVSRLADLLGFDGFYMTNSPDIRGIDNAVLFKEDKLKPLGFEERQVEGTHKRTRNISVATFQLSGALGGGILAIYPVHWPSQGGPTIERIHAAETLRNLIDDQRAEYRRSDYNAMIMGDFNTLAKENPHPINSVILDENWSAHFSDVRRMAERNDNPYLDRMPQASYYYNVNHEWNEFDHIIVNENLADGAGLDVDTDSYRINAPAFLSKTNDNGERIPFRYNHRTTNPKFLGYSDHFAVHVKLHYRKGK